MKTVSAAFPALVTALLGTFLLGNIAQALAQGPYPSQEQYQLLTPKVGWVQSKSRTLSWTNDGGLHWEDITPPAIREAPPPRRIMNLPIFFLNSTTGWVLSDVRQAPGTQQQEHRMGQLTSEYALAATTDAGKTWSLTYFTLPTLQPIAMAFADSTHGWILIPTMVSMGISPSSHGASTERFQLTGEFF
jgi:hypothetical protein